MLVVDRRYVPYSPDVVAKFGLDERTNLPICSGPDPPDGLDPLTEAAGFGLRPPSIAYPILQTYIDVCLTGCLEYGPDFAREFIATTFKWSPYWLNERAIARRPWINQAQYVEVDALLRDHCPEYFKYRKLESEYAVLFSQ